MGKVRGKKGRKDDIKNKAKKDAKISKRPPNPAKIEGKRLARAKKEARIAELKEMIAKDPTLLKPYDTPMQRTAPLMSNPNAAKWPNLFKRQLGLIEMHIDSLNRIRDSMKDDWKKMSAQDALDWRLGERGNWRAICGMLDRARLVLSQTREAAQGVLPPERMPEKKKFGMTGLTTFELEVPKLDEEAKAEGYDPKGRGALGRSMDHLDSDGDSEIADAPDDSSDSSSTSDSSSDSSDSDSDSDEDETNNAQAVTADENGTSNVESAPAFFIDTEPTPVNIQTPKVQKPNDGLSNRKRKQAEKDKLKAERLAKRMAKKAAYEAEKARKAREAAQAPQEIRVEQAQSLSTVVDFKELEAKLQAELEEGTKAQQKAEAREAEAAEKKAHKKRRRSSEGGDEAARKAKKEKVDEEEEVIEKSRKEKKSKTLDGEEVVERPKKSKRKAGDDEEDDGSKKKKKKKSKEESR